MKHTLVILIAAGLSVTANAQVVPDTLDNERYFPLHVGNEWHYTTVDFIVPIPSYERRTVLSDTLVDGRRYVEVRRQRFDAVFALTHESAAWLTYNAVGSVLEFSDIDADSISAVDSTTQWYHADFGDSLETVYGQSFVGGTYDTTITFAGPTEVQVAAIKTLRVPEPFGGMGDLAPETYAADIGLIGSSVFDGPSTTLSYARIDAAEYGTPVVQVGIEAAASPSSSTRPGGELRIWPNPAVRSITIGADNPHAGDLEVRLFDVLGRRVLTRRMLSTEYSFNAIHVDVSTLSSGMYFALLLSSGRFVGSGSFVVL